MGGGHGAMAVAGELVTAWYQAPMHPMQVNVVHLM